jgi:hypothetical protein
MPISAISFAFFGILQPSLPLLATQSLTVFSVIAGPPLLCVFLVFFCPLAEPFAAFIFIFCLPLLSATALLIGAGGNQPTSNRYRRPFQYPSYFGNCAVTSSHDLCLPFVHGN